MSEKFEQDENTRLHNRDSPQKLNSRCRRHKRRSKVVILFGLSVCVLILVLGTLASFLLFEGGGGKNVHVYDGEIEQ